MSWQRSVAGSVLRAGARTSDELKPRAVVKAAPTPEDLMRAFEQGRIDYGRRKHSVPYSDRLKAERWEAGYHFERELRK